MSKKRKDLTKGNPFSTILTYAIPVIGGNLFQLFYTLADSMIVGQTLGADALAAVGATSTVIYLVLCFIQGITSGFGIRLGHRVGQRDERGIRSSIAASTCLSGLFSLALTLAGCLLSHPILRWLHTPENIYTMAYDYMFVILLGTGATVFYNLVSNLLRALGDSRTPLSCLIFSSLLNIVLDVVFIVPLGMGVAGAAWATVLSQLLAALLSALVGIKKFAALRLRRTDFRVSRTDLAVHLGTGFPMGFQMSVMCIGQLSMQGAVNALGADAIAGYTAATKVDQLSVLVVGAMGMAISNYVAQNYGAGYMRRIRSGVAACLLQTSIAALAMCALILCCRHLVVPLFVSQPTPQICLYSDQYLIGVAPFYLLLGLLMMYRSAIQGMGNTLVPFLACITELVLRVAATTLLTAQVGYWGVCFASPLAWLGACLVLVPAYRRSIRRALQREDQDTASPVRVHTPSPMTR